MKKLSKFCYEAIAFTIAVIILSVTAFAAGAIIEKKAVPSQNIFMLNGKEIAFDSAYSIEDSNYVQLASVARALNGTASQFNVYWDNDLRIVVIETGKAYTGVKPEPKPVETIYSIGDTFVTDNCEITVTGYRFEERTEYGEYWAFADIDILLTNSNNTDKTDTFGKFFEEAVDESGKLHRGFSFQGYHFVSPNEKRSYTMEWSMPGLVDMSTLTVKDPLTKETATFSLK